jgi:hypothetical protein
VQDIASSLLTPVLACRTNRKIGAFPFLLPPFTCNTLYAWSSSAALSPFVERWKGCVLRKLNTRLLMPFLPPPPPHHSACSIFSSTLVASE